MNIILYSTGCPKCKILRSKLDSKNISYIIESDVEKMLSLGMTTMPMLSVNNKLMNFTDAVKWINNIKEAGDTF